MRPTIVAITAVVAILASAGAGVVAEDEIPGVTGDLTLVEKNRDNAKTVDKIKVQVDDEVEITWTYPIVPAAIPTKVSARSSGDSVKFDDIVRVSRPRIVGAGILGAFFTAKKVGTATLKFEINTEAGGVILECQVEVVE